MLRLALVSVAFTTACALTTPAAPPAVVPETSATVARAPAVPAPAAPVPVAPAAPAPAAPTVAREQFGAAITDGTTVALADIIAHPARFAGQTVLTAGTVTAVCQSRGCWMQLGDNDNRVHVRMHGHSFFIPRNASGRRARVQATVLSGLPNGHCESEATEQTGHVARLELDATGVELD